jgi:DNA mismatch repair protein MutL
VRFRQQSFVHDFVRESIRTALLKTRSVPEFVNELHAQPNAAPALTPTLHSGETPRATKAAVAAVLDNLNFALQPPSVPPRNERLGFEAAPPIDVAANAAKALAPSVSIPLPPIARNGSACGGPLPIEEAEVPLSIAGLEPLGQVRNSFIIAVDPSGLWIIDQHVAHERILFEKVLSERAGSHRETQRLLMPLIIELTPAQQAIFAEIGDELARNGFEAEAFGARTIAVKAAPAELDAAAIEHLLHELLEQFAREEQAVNLEKVRGEIAASIACHAAIKVNMPLDQTKMRWLLAELAKTECPTSCPHGRPVLLRYSLKDLQKAFKRI